MTVVVKKELLLGTVYSEEKKTWLEARREAMDHDDV
jgi:hypothetical protein